MENILKSQTHATPEETVLHKRKSFFSTFLLEKEIIFENICTKNSITHTIIMLFIICAIGAGLMGLSLGFYSMDTKQFIASTVKLPLLLILSMAICVPSLFMFNTLTGNKMRLSQMISLVMLGLADMSVFLASFSPIMLFFIFSSRHYVFIQFLLTVFCAVAGYISFRTIRNGNAYYNKKFNYSSSSLILYIWLLIYGFVGLQLSWILRPYIGSPSLDFTLFREAGSNIFLHFLNAF